MRRLAIAATCALGIALPAATTAFAETTLNIGLREDPDLLDPILGSSYVGRIVFAGLCDKLFDISPDMKIVPQLASGYEYKDPTHLVIHLRPGVKFQDNEPVDAAAVKFTLTRALTVKGSMRRGEINSIQSIEVDDPLTVTVELKSPDSPLLSQLTDRSGMVLPPKVVEQEDRKFGLHPVCSGPFSFVERVPQDRIVLQRFPGYWNAGAIHIDRVIYLPTPNAAVRLANLQAGALDLVEQILPTDVPAVQHDPKLKLAIQNSLMYEGITFNTDNGPTAKTVIGQNALVRRAFELAIDRTTLIQVVYAGMYTPTAQANPPSSPYYDASITPPTRDVAKAKALLQQAGVTLPVPVTITIPNNPDLQQAGQVIQAMAKEAGFDVKLQAMEFASSLQAGYAGRFQAYMIGWSGRSDPDGNMWQFLHTGGTFNYGHYSNPAVDKALDDARLTTDIAKRRDLYAQVWHQEREDLPLLYLWNPKNIVGMRKTVEGFVQVPDGLIRLQGVSIAK
ncbi:MAG TPA: ABC transporter substrate-binding protein [Acetobacteraceae bacterium]|nr:ABC transporter substrate-binding protein [Acetobacteraceae bacterium]